MSELYNKLIKELQAPFPKGTVIQRNNKPYIPVQAYLSRLEEVAGEHWSWEIIDFPLIQTETLTVIVKGQLTIAGVKRQGIGLSPFKEVHGNFIKAAIGTADSEAFRDACDKFLLGWSDLAPYREWGKNPAVQSMLQTTSNQNVNVISNNSSVEGSKCLKCKKPLSNEERLFLQAHEINLTYCGQHIPSHFLKGRGQK